MIDLTAHVSTALGVRSSHIAQDILELVKLGCKERVGDKLITSWLLCYLFRCETERGGVVNTLKYPARVQPVLDGWIESGYITYGRNMFNPFETGSHRVVLSPTARLDAAYCMFITAARNEKFNLNNMETEDATS